MSSDDSRASDMELVEVVSSAATAEGDKTEAVHASSATEPASEPRSAGQVKVETSDDAEAPALRETKEGGGDSPLSAKSPTSKPAPSKFLNFAGEPARLEWHDVKFDVKQRGKVKPILHGVSGAANPGSIVALMG
jgi:hypothetical protein